MEKIIAQQLAQKEILEKFMKNYRKDGKERRSYNYYQKRLSEFQSRWNTAVSFHQEILTLKNMNPKQGESDPYFENDVFSAMETHFMDSYAEIEDRFQLEYPSGPNQSHNQKEITVVHSRNEDSIKLPKITLEKFSGDYRKWPTFHDLFRTLVHENSSLSKVQKLQYLKLHLTGEAETLLRHFQVTEGNYEDAWNLLEDRYDNKRVLVNTHLKVLLSQNTLSAETANGIKNLLDTTTECLQALKNLGVPTDNWNVLIVYLTVQKLPPETHSLWEQSLSNQKDLPDWATLQEFLKTRFRTLEAITLKRHPTVNKDARNYTGKPRAVTQSFFTSSGTLCPVCGGQHGVRQCSKFISMNFDQKLEMVKKRGLCINCLGSGHLRIKCPSKLRCSICKQSHHTLMHRDPVESSGDTTKRYPLFPSSNGPSLRSHRNDPPTVSVVARQELAQPQPPLSASASTFIPQGNDSHPSPVNSFLINEIHRNRETLLATALVRVVTPSGREQVLRALIDQGSQATFVTEAAIQALQLPKESVRANVSGVGQTYAGQVSAKVHLMLKPLNNDEIAVEAVGLALKKLTHFLPSRRIRIEEWKHIHGLKLADPQFHQPGKIDLLLGVDIYSKIIQDGLIKGKEGTPVAQQTIFGWILLGEIVDTQNVTTMINNFHVLTDLDNQLRLFWELEDVQLVKVPSKEEQRCEEIFLNTHRRTEDGRYEVALPFDDLEGTKQLGESRSIAVTRLRQMEARLKKDPLLKDEYTKCIREYNTLGHMELVDEHGKDTIVNQHKEELHPHCYLPHHAVIKEDSTTTKVRVVFDASKQTSNGLSLNDILLKGPTVQDELACLLLRWRKYYIAFTADIEKMYRQIWVKSSQTNYQRIVWRESADGPLLDYKLLTVTFGTKSAPYLATRVLQQLAKDERDKYPIGAEAALTEFYVDDLLSGADIVETALEKQRQLIGLLKSGGFTLRKWASNCPRLLEDVPEEHRELKVSLNNDEPGQIKALGLFWDPFNDILCYCLRLGEPQQLYTKRSVLSDIAKLYDPLGLVAPSNIMAKIFMQKLWLAKIDWDEPLPDMLEKEWMAFRKGIMEIGTITIPRWVHYSESNCGVEVHGFSDASLLAYAAVAYICVTDCEGKRRTTILSAKTKVSPIKTVSLPRLELCGAFLLAKLLRYVVDSLKIPNPALYAWTDSEIVLAWLKGHPSKWQTFIANRVSHIHDLIGEATWRYVPSKENPADCASRGMLPSELKTYSLWWNGPKWLQQSKSNWPDRRDIPDTKLERRKSSVNCLQVTKENWEEKYSSLTKLLRITAYCYRFKSKQKGYLKATELDRALVIWLKKAQSEHFSEEMNSLKNGNPIKRSSRLINLTPFIHSDGLLRVGGRLQHAELPFNEKYPIILPDKEYLTNLIIDKTHKDTLHGGPQLMMRVMAKRFWLMNARNTIRQHIHKCIPCFKQKAEVQTQLMGNLPRSRVTMSRPFSHVGVDYCGPIELRKHKGRGSLTYKGYISIFICMAVKAIHIELVTDLSAQGFIAAFRRFTSRRGLPSNVYCDCGSNFVGAHKILTRQQRQMVDNLNAEIASLIENEGPSFHFIPPASPHFGGLWESGVRSTKYHMKRILGTNTLTYEEMSTVLTQIEACLNSRPLSAASRDPNDLTPLTPAHFLIGEILLTPPEPSVLDLNVHRLDRWQYIQRLHQSFWKRWNTEYLCRLQQRPKWTRKQDNLKVGDLVILKEDNLPPSRWLLGRIIDTHPGTDGLVRVVTVKTKESILKRPVVKICLLPIEAPSEQNAQPQA